MPVLFATADRQLGAEAYRGPDRRHLIARTAQPVDTWWLTAAAAGVVAAPLLAAAFMTGSVLGFEAWETGIGDAALIAYGGAALLLGLRWRLVGEAICIPLAAATAIVALGYVPPTIHVGINSAPVVGVRLASGAVLVGLVLLALRSEEVRSDLRPVRAITLTFVVTGLLTLPLSVGPLRSLVASSMAGVRIWGVAEAAVELAVGVAVLIVALRRGRHLLVAVGVMLFTVAAASALRAVDPHGPLLDVAALCLLAGAVELVVTSAGDLQGAMNAVVNHDVRGSRRWETAQAELHEMRTSMQGRRHDLRNILAGVDGTLMVLADEAHYMPEDEVKRMITAVRQEVQLLQLVVGDGVEARSYDLSDLLGAIVDVRACGQQGVLTEIQPGLHVQGRPDRLAIAVDNLLVNVAVHAPDANVVLVARRLGGQDDLVEIVVSDDGRGLEESELAMASEPGWRSAASADRPGSGLGLAQVKKLIEAEGGDVLLEPTYRGIDTPGKGLTVRLRVPVRHSN